MPHTTGQGCFYTVGFSANEVCEWSKSWPCFGTPRSLWFQFDRRNGDLVDMSDTGDIDESALLALSQDAQNA